MNAVTVPAAPSSPLAPFRFLLAGIGVINLVSGVGLVGWATVFSSMMKSFSPLLRSDDPSQKIFILFVVEAVAMFLLGAFQLFASSQVKAQRRFILCCVAFASLLLPFSMFQYLGGACGLFAIYKLTRPEVRSTFA